MNNATKQALEPNLNAYLSLCASDACPDPMAAVRSALNLHRLPIERRTEGLVFASRTVASHVVEMSDKAADFVMNELVNKYTVSDPSVIQLAIRQQWVNFNTSKDRVRLGQFYTPEHVTAQFKELLDPVLDLLPKNTVLLDPAVGTRALLSLDNSHRCIGADIDPRAVAINAELGYDDVLETNSLCDVSRAKFGVGESDPLVLVMNPPFNNKTSMHHRAEKTGQVHTCDAAVAAPDLGVSFLKLGVVLKADAMVVIHPWSLLGKQNNFRDLGSFSSDYRLTQGAIFSSAEFGLKGEEFPVLIGVYRPGSMTYEDFRQMELPIYRNVGGTLMHDGEFLKLAHAQSLTKPIRGGTPTKDMRQDSEFGIYQFNLRDNNNVKSTANLTTKRSSSTIPVQASNLGHYSHINCLRRYLENDFTTGNLNPLVREADLQDAEYLDACIYDTVMSNQGLLPFDRKNKASIVVTHQLLAKAMQKAPLFKGSGVNPHQAFVDFWATGTAANALAPFFNAYFAKLKKDCILVKKTPIATVMGTSKLAPTLAPQVGTAIPVAIDAPLTKLVVATLQRAMGLTP